MYEIKASDFQTTRVGQPGAAQVCCNVVCNTTFLCCSAASRAMGDTWRTVSATVSWAWHKEEAHDRFPTPDGYQLPENWEIFGVEWPYARERREFWASSKGQWVLQKSRGLSAWCAHHKSQAVQRGGQYYPRVKPADRCVVRGAKYAAQGTLKCTEFTAKGVCYFLFSPVIFTKMALNYRYRRPTQEDIRQGALGNCYFLAVLATLAKQKPSLIRNNLRKCLYRIGTYIHELRTNDGRELFKVRFYKRNDEGETEEVWVTIDNYLDSKLAQTADKDGNGRQEIWPALYEKAYMQFVGEKKLSIKPPNMSILDWGKHLVGQGGHGREAYMALTGKQAVTMSLPGQFALSHWVNIQNDKQLRSILICSGLVPMVIGSKGQTDSKATDGVVDSHMYSIVGFQRLNREDCLLIRNPWGKTEAFNPEDCVIDQCDDGIFAIKLKALSKYFQMITVSDNAQLQLLLQAHNDSVFSNSRAVRFTFQVKQAGAAMSAQKARLKQLAGMDPQQPKSSVLGEMK